MKVNMTATVAEQPELHRGESGENSDPAMAFLAVLGELLPKSSASLVAEVPGGNLGTAGPGGVTPAAAMPSATGVGAMSVGGSTTVTGAPTSAATVPVEVAIASAVLSATVVPGLAPGSSKVSVPGSAVLPEHPMIAVDRAGLPTVGGPTTVAGAPTSAATVPVEVVLADSVLPAATVPRPTPGSSKVSVPGSAVLPANGKDAVVIGLSVPGSAVLPEHPMIAVDRAGLPTVGGPTTVAGAPTSTATVPVDAALTSTVLSATVAPGLTSGSPKASVPGPKVVPEHSLTAASRVGLPVADSPIEVQEVAVTPPPVPGPVKEQPGLDAEVHKAGSRPGHPGGPGLEHAKSIPTAPDRAEGDQAEPVSTNLATTAATLARLEPAATIATPGSSQPQVATQLAPYIAALRHGLDGTHQITVVLHPVDLGRVQVTVELRNGTVHLQLTGAHDAAREALSGALPQLRRELTDAGLSVGRTDVLSQDSGTAGGPATGRNPGHGDQPGPGHPSSQSAHDDRSSRRVSIVPDSSVPPTWRVGHVGVLDVTI